MRKIIQIICCVLVILGCKEKQHINYNPVPDALKKACLFQRNSYWVYRNDSSSITDCTYIKTTPVLGSTSFNESELIEYIMTPLQGGLFYQFYISGEPSFDSQSGYRFQAAIYHANICEGLPAYILYFDTLTNHNGYDYCNPCGYKYPCPAQSSFSQIGTYAAFSLNDLNFDRVEVTRTKFKSPYIYQPELPDNDSVDFYFCPGKGLVKIILRIDTANNYQVPKRATMSWSLLRYNVVQ